jgi:hypothetical protein
MRLSESQVSEFQQNGFVVVKGFFGPGDMKIISEWLDGLAAQGGGEGKFFETSETTGESILVRIEDIFGGNNHDFAERLISPARAPAWISCWARRRFSSRKIKGLSQIADFWGYHGTYAQEPAQQI